MDDLKKTINSVLYERITSTLYGTFILSWIASNWKAFYIMVFVSADTLDTNKLEYILDNYYPCWIWNLFKLLIIPGVSTFIFIKWMPDLVNKAFEINEEYKNRRRIFKSNKLDEVPVPRNKHREVVAEYESRLNLYSGIAQEKKDWEEQKRGFENTFNEQAKKIIDLEKANNNLNNELLKTSQKNEELNNKINFINPCLADMFQGRWINNFMFSNGAKSSEIVEIKEGYKYFKNGVHTFNIDQYFIDLKAGSMKFRKVSITDSSVAENILSIIDKNKYKGTEPNGVKVEYTRDEM